MRKIYISFIFLMFFGMFGFVNGQTSEGGTAVAFSLSPTHPGPNENVTITTSSFQIKLNETFISWYNNGELKLSGIGKKNFTFVTGKIGKTTTIKVVVDAQSFGQVMKEIIISPADLDILWESDTYTPPFYKGKALPTSRSSVRVIPFPSFAEKKGYYSSKDLIYTWKNGYFENADDSGYGKNTFIYKSGYTFGTNEINTTVSTTNSGMVISKKTFIPVYEPKIVFYENKPLEGVRYENYLGDTFQFINSEVIIHAVPYFFSLSGINDNSALFTWKLDGKNLSINPDNKTEFTFRKPSEGTGRFQMKLDINNTGYELQTASKNITFSYTN